MVVSATIRQELHQQIDRLPDDIVEKIANFTRLISPEPNNIQNILIGKMKTGKSPQRSIVTREQIARS